MENINIQIPEGHELKRVDETTFKLVPIIPKQKKWEDFGEVEGYSVDLTGFISMNKRDKAYKYNKTTHPTMLEAKSALALSQLEQWRDKANGEKLADWCDWEDAFQIKHIILRDKNKIESGSTHMSFHPIAFKTKEIKDQFLLDHKDLLEEYFMIKK